MTIPTRNWLRLALGVLAGVALTVGWGEVRAAQETPASAYVKRRWQVNDGLPHPVVYKIVQGERGYMWLATFGGLVRFDGRDFAPTGAAGQPVAADDSVRNVAVEDGEMLIALTEAPGVYRYRNGEFTPHPVNDDVAGMSFVDMLVESDGVLWLGAADGTLVRWEAGNTSIFDLSDRLRDTTIGFSFAVDHAGNTWVARGRFLGCFKGGEMVPFPEPIGEGICIGSGQDGRPWIGSSFGLFRLDGATLEAVPLDREWPSPKSGLTQLMEDSRGSLWVGTWRQGVYRVTGGRLVPVDDFYEYVTSILEDTEGNIWLSYAGGGVVRLRTRDFFVLDSSVGLPRPASLSVSVDDFGAVWCANRSGGLVRYFRGTVQSFTTAAGEVPFVTAVCPDRHGRIWVGTTDGTYTIDVRDPQFLVRQPGSYGVVSLLYCAENRDMWVNSSLGGLRVFRDDVLWGAFGNTHGVPATRLSGIAQDGRGTIWVSTLRGELLRLVDSGEYFEPFDRVPPEFTGEIYAISRDSRGDIWAGTSQGLLFCGGEEWRLLGTEQGIPDAKVSQVLEDGRAHLWLGSRKGLWHASLDDLRAVVAGRLPAVAGILVGENEGLPLAASVPSMQPRAWAESSGRLWFATYAGIIGISPGMAAAPRPAPPVYIEEVYLDGELVSDPRSLVIPPGRHAVEFRFSAPTFTAPHLLRLRHRLEGYDNDWVRTPDDRGAQYGNLPPGRYSLRVAVRNVNGEWGADEATLSFEVEAAWWQNDWLVGGGATALVVFLAAVVRLWTQRRFRERIQRMERMQALERERTRIARDLHDEVGTSLTRIGFMSERLKRHAPSGELRTDLDQLAAQTRRVTADLESIVWTVNPKNQTWDRFALYLSRYAQELFRDTPVRCSVEGDDDVPSAALPPDAQRHLLAIYKEALNNVMKHARATRVEVAMELRNSTFRVQIRDDGIGFDRALEQDTLRNGLRNMHARMRELGGELKVETGPKGGTCITCAVQAVPPRDA